MSAIERIGKQDGDVEMSFVIPQLEFCFEAERPTAYSGYFQTCRTVRWKYEMCSDFGRNVSRQPQVCIIFYATE